MSNFKLIKEKFSREHHVVCNEKKKPSKLKRSVTGPRNKTLKTDNDNNQSYVTVINSLSLLTPSTSLHNLTMSIELSILVKILMSGRNVGNYNCSLSYFIIIYQILICLYESLSGTLTE